MEPELCKQVSDLFVALIPYGLGVVCTAFMIEWIRRRWRNGSGNRRDDNGEAWTSQMLILLGKMDEKLTNIHVALTNDLVHKIGDLSDAIERHRREEDKR